MAPILDIFRALADPTRLRIMHLLREMELSVGEIAQVVGQSQPRVSRHIRILAEADLIDRRKEGSWVFLRLRADPALEPLLVYLDSAVMSESEELWVRADRVRLAAVRSDRARAADQFFDEHADEWDAIRSLHVAEGDVEAAMQRLMADRPLGRLLDIGTGTGRMIELFGPRAEQVCAVDRSPEMLRIARAKVPSDGVAKYELVMGDFYALPLADASVDTVILHQVLHYAQQPETVIAEAGRVSAPGGWLLIVDFAPHGLEVLRDRDAHARLGFSDEQIAGWFAASGFRPAATETLPGKELTVKLWLAQRG